MPDAHFLICCGCLVWFVILAGTHPAGWTQEEEP